MSRLPLPGGILSLKDDLQRAGTMWPRGQLRQCTTCWICVGGHGCGPKCMLRWRPRWPTREQYQNLKSFISVPGWKLDKSASTAAVNDQSPILYIMKF